MKAESFPNQVGLHVWVQLLGCERWGWVVWVPLSGSERWGWGF